MGIAGKLDGTQMEWTGPDVIFLIQERQNNPHLLEDLAEAVMAFERQYAAEINQAVGSVTHLKEAKGEQPAEDGFLLTVTYHKEADPKDVMHWRQRKWFLATDEHGKINSLAELEEQEYDGSEGGEPWFRLNMGEGDA